jgi:hypothetical protein
MTLRRIAPILAAWSFLSVLLLLSVPRSETAPGPGSNLHSRYWDLGAVHEPGQITFYNEDPFDAQNGLPVYGGDMNGDGLAEVTYTAFRADGPPGFFLDDAGEVHVWTSNGVLNGTIDVGSSSGGLRTYHGEDAGDHLGIRVSIDDVDGDGLGDLLMGAFGGDIPGRDLCGKVYVAFGDSVLPTGDWWLANPAPWLTTIVGAEADDRLGTWFDAGDVNGDGVADLVIGADRADGFGNFRPQAGDTYVIYGPIPRGVTLDLADTSFAWTVLHGVDPEDHFGATVVCDDLDGDGYAEVLTSAASNALARNVLDNGGSGDGPPGNFRDSCGDTWIVWGRPDLPRVIDLRTNVTYVTTTIYGRDRFGRYGEELGTGDVDGDGTIDLCMGGLTAPGPPGDYRKDGGVGVIFYDMELTRGHVIDLAAPPPWLRLTWIYGAARSLTTDSFPTGDIDGDGRTDLLLGSPRDVGPQARNAGTTTIVYGADDLPDFIDLVNPPPPDQVRMTVLEGKDANDLVAYWAAAADVNGDGCDDAIINAMNGDGPRNNREMAGEVYVVDGAWVSRTPDQPKGFRLVAETSDGGIDFAVDPPDDPLIDRVRVYWSEREELRGTAYEEFRLDQPSRRLLSPPPGPVYWYRAAFVRADGTEGRRTLPVPGRIGSGPSPTLVDIRPTPQGVRLDWTPSGNPNAWGVQVYRGPAGGDPVDMVRISPGPVSGTTFVDAAPDSYVAVDYRLTELDTEFFESGWSAPATIYVHAPAPYPTKILVVNGFDWVGWSDGPGTAKAVDPWEMYRDRAITADRSFDFWDLYENWTNYPPGFEPIGKGPLPPERLFQYSLVIWVGNDNSGTSVADRAVVRELLPDLRVYLDDGGKLILLSRFLGSYVDDAFGRDIGRVVAWGRYEQFSDASPAWALLPGLSNLTPMTGQAVVPFCEVMTLDNSGLATPIFEYRSSPLYEPVLGILAHHPVGGTPRAAFLSLPPNYVDPTEMAATMKELIFRLTGFGSETSVGVPETPTPAGARRLSAAPNPAPGRTTIYAVPAAPGPARVEVFDAAGRFVRLLYEGTPAPGGLVVDWDGHDAAGRTAASGLYFARLADPSGSVVRRIVLLR